MEQDIRFTELDGRRIAYATVGEGPLLLFGGRWITHLEEEWDDPRTRAFFEDLAATHRVVRYDRIGAGLSDRALPAGATLELDTRSLATVHAAVGSEPAIVFACSCAGLATADYASRRPELVRKIVFFGGDASRGGPPPAKRPPPLGFLPPQRAPSAPM